MSEENQESFTPEQLEFIHQVTYLDEILKIRSKQHNVVRLYNKVSGNPLPDFARAQSKRLVTFSDCLSNYHKTVLVPRVFDVNVTNHEVSQHFDYLSYAVAKGHNGVFGTIGLIGEEKSFGLFGDNFDGPAYILMDHAFQIATELPGEKSFSIRMLEINKNGYFDLLTDYKKSKIDEINVIDSLTEIPVDSVNLIGEWVEQGNKFIGNEVSKRIRNKFNKDSTLILYFIIESIIDDQVTTSTFTFIDFPSIEYIYSDVNSVLFKSFLGDTLDTTHVLYSIFNPDSYKGFLFNINTGIDYAPQTSNLMYLLSEIGDISLWKISSHLTSDELKYEINDLRKQIPRLLKNFTGLYPALKHESDIIAQSRDYEKISNAIDNENVVLMKPLFDKRGKLVRECESWQKTTDNIEIQRKLMESRYNSKNNDLLSKNYYKEDYDNKQREIEKLIIDINSVYNEAKKNGNVLLKYKTEYKLDYTPPHLQNPDSFIKKIQTK